MSAIIGRKREKEELYRLYHLQKAQLVAVYGRRRVGKTYLIRELFKEEFAFYHTGVSPVELQGVNLLEAQLAAFNTSLIRYGGKHEARPKTWMEAFQRLSTLLKSQDAKKRLVVFIDEMPWMDTPRSGFITAFEHFWNGWGSGQENLMLIVCGSATSWIQDNLINSYGGLYDRINAEICLQPFNLHETEQLLISQGVTMARYDILQLYMAVGGIPMYLSYVQPGQSLAQTIDNLIFSRHAKLRNEFERLFHSIFKNPAPYISIIKTLAKRQAGYNREDISHLTGIPSGDRLSKILKALETSDFIELYKPFENTKRDKQYRLIDPFCIFYLTQVEDRERGEHFWRDNENLPTLSTWRGRAFENICIKHVEQIKMALGVAGVSSDNAPWTMRGTDEQEGMQVDLVINRSDRVINLCEMKFVVGDFEVKKDYDRKLRNRLNWIVEHTDKRRNVQMTLVTTFGLKYGLHSSIFQKVVTMDSLFAE